MNRHFDRFIWILFLGLVVATEPVFAQEPAGGSDNIVFPASYFSEFAPITANDMLDRVPGIELIRSGSNIARSNSGGAERGLGAESPILIDGKRLAGKANEAQTQLQRIPAEQVNYIEIIRGTSSSLDVQNTGQLVNIVLLSARSQSSFSTEVTADLHENGNSLPGGSLALSGQRGTLTYLFSAAVKNRYEERENFEESLHGDLSLNEYIDWDRTAETVTYELNSNLAYSPTDVDRLALNLLYSEAEPETSVYRLFTDFNGPAPSNYTERETIPATSDSWEVGGDYEHRFQNGNRFKALTIVNEKVDDTLRQRYLATVVGGAERQNLYLNTYSRYRERILRSSYITSLGAGQGLEFGLEVAQTIQDSRLLLATPPTIPGGTLYGGLTRANLPNAASTVEELRYEPFLIHNWQISPRLTLETSLVAEWSEISQTGDVSNSRDFDYIKPKFDLRYNINNSMQARVSLENVVSQLSFADFSRNINERDDDQDTVAGNPLLEPEESWWLELGFDYRLPRDGGAFNARYFHYEYDNKIGRIDISPNATDLQTTNGNIGAAQAYGLILNTSIRLGFLGLPTALFTGMARIQESEFDDDPLTPREHGFPPFDRGSFQLGFRHDIPALTMNYGINWMPRIKDGRRAFEIDNEFDFVVPDNLTAYVEKTGLWGLTYRLEANNLTDYHACGIRYRYFGNILDDRLKEVEQNCFTSGRSFTFRVRGTF